MYAFSQKTEEVLKAQNTTNKGLTQAEAQTRQQVYGFNILENHEEGWLIILVRQFWSLITLILVFSATLSIFLGEKKDTIFIVSIILLNGLLGFWQEMRARSSLKALSTITESHVQVRRSGELTIFPSSQLVPGDILELGEGNVIPADVRWLELESLQVDEGIITGESLPVNKEAGVVLAPESLPFEWKNMGLSGTIIVKGKGLGVVTSTGKNTYFASIANKATEKTPDTPLNKAIAVFLRRFILFIFVALGLVGILALLRGQSLSEISYLLTAQLVSAIPGGLPTVLTLILGVGALQLQKYQVLVRHLPAVETLGSTTVIATDKTGTITTSKIQVQEVFSLDEPKLKLVASLANESKNLTGDPIDVALIRWLGSEFKLNSEAYPLLHLFPFDTSLRITGAVHQINGQKILLVKGAFETLQTKLANPSNLPLLQKKHDEMASQGLRVLAFGYQETSDWENIDNWKLDLLGLIGFQDPAKSGVSEAVRIAQKAGIKILMLTGDSPLTAKAIAQEVNIYKSGDEVLTGYDLLKIPKDELYNKLAKATVLARVLPEHKYQIVKTLQEHHQIVAVTGDGVNDVPALKIADLGIAMGSGTEAAKSVSQMILVDNNLGAIVEAIRKARVITDNIRKVIYFLVSTHITEIFLLTFSILLGLKSPLSATQILWTNLITDGLLDKFFPFLEAEEDVMLRKPILPEKKFFDRIQILRMTVIGSFIALANLGVFVFLLSQNVSHTTASTATLTSLIFSEWLNGLEAQTENRPLFHKFHFKFGLNSLMWLAVGFGVLLQISVIYLFPSLIKAEPLGILEWVSIVTCTLVVFAFIEASKWFGWFRKTQ